MDRKKLTAFVIIGVVFIGGLWLGSQSGHSTPVYIPQEPITATSPTTHTTPHGSYITYQEYLTSPDAYKNHKRIYFFRTNWCFACKIIAAEARANPTLIPENIAVIEVDFDTQAELRSKYDVTSQTTFVQVAADGTKLGQWHAQNFREAVAQVR